MKWIVSQCVQFLIKNNAIDPEDTDIYEYGLFCIVRDIITLSSTLIIAILLDVVPQSVLFYAAFIGLRRTAGGYHATTVLRCFLISMVTWLVALKCIELTQSYHVLSIGIAAFATVIIWLLAPIEHINNPHRKERLVLAKRNCRIYISILLLVVCISAWGSLQFLWPDWIPSSVAYGMFFFSCSLVAAWLQRRFKQQKQLAE
ncbi:MAG: accessory gene regulator B family protein [Christensenellales bacterium]|jgi:accessory gene regulator B